MTENDRINLDLDMQKVIDENFKTGNKDALLVLRVEQHENGIATSGNILGNAQVIEKGLTHMLLRERNLINVVFRAVIRAKQISNENVPNQLLNM